MKMSPLFVTYIILINVANLLKYNLQKIENVVRNSL